MQQSTSGEGIGEKFELFAERFDHLTLFPESTTEKPFLVGLIGNVGSGKTTFARLLNDRIPGSVIVQANSARYLLRQANLPWGENVRDLTWQMVLRYAIRGLTVIVDGGTTERGARDQLFRIAAARGIPLWFIRLEAPMQVCRQRTYAKYIDADWVSSFQECRVAREAETMVANVEARAAAHDELWNDDIEGLLAVVSNGHGRDYLERQALDVASALMSARGLWTESY